jgi:hypothetical protein
MASDTTSPNKDVGFFERLKSYLPGSPVKSPSSDTTPTAESPSQSTTPSGDVGGRSRKRGGKSKKVRKSKKTRKQKRRS